MLFLTSKIVYISKIVLYLHIGDNQNSGLLRPQTTNREKVYGPKKENQPNQRRRGGNAVSVAIRQWQHRSDIGTMAKAETQIHHRRNIYETFGGEALRSPLAIGQEVFVPSIN